MNPHAYELDACIHAAPPRGRYVIIYLWRGERHRSDSFPTYDEARDVLAEYLSQGWQAWIEAL